MPKALFFNVPAHGHVNPSLPLVSELVKRGHHIRYFITEAHHERVSKTGAEVSLYTSVKDDFFDRQGLDGSVPQKAAKALLETTKEILPELIQITHDEQPDYIIYDCMCTWGYFLAKTMHLPSVSSFSLMPISPRLILNWRVIKVMLPMLFKGVDSGISAYRLSNQLGKQYDVKPLDMMSLLNAPGDLSISYSSAEIVPFGHTLPDHYRLVGWSMPDTHTDETFTHQSDCPLIYISLGTVINANVSFFRACIGAFTDTDYEVLISTGGGIKPETFGTLPDNITIKSWVPQVQVLKHASLFITHGGVNSLHEGLTCGAPLLIIPQQAEQMINGLQVINIGAGLMLKQNHTNVSSIRAKAEQILSNTQFKTWAEHLAKSLQTAGGVVKAVDEIELLLSRH